MRMKFLLNKWFYIVLLLLLVLAEVVLRFGAGLGNIPVYVNNKNYEYMYAPNQDLYRFHNHVKTNNLGLRSKEALKSDVIRILKFGDSVINGGPHVDQDNLSTTILENELTRKYQKPVRVFNISAQSWGPDNAFAFLKQHGHFGSRIFVLVFSSHDLHDNMHFKKVVGNHRAWPASQPWCAFTDGFNRYLIPKVKGWFGAETEDYNYLYDFNDTEINPGWKSFIDYSKENRIKLIVYLHATTDELGKKKYDKYGTELLDLLQSDSVTVIQGISEITSPTCYRDNIHLNEKGHAALAKVLEPILLKEIQNLSQSE